MTEQGPAPAEAEAGPCRLYAWDIQAPLYFFLVAMPPRMCRSALFSSRTRLACSYSGRLNPGRRSDRSLCFVVTN